MTEHDIHALWIRIWGPTEIQALTAQWRAVARQRQLTREELDMLADYSEWAGEETWRPPCQTH